jgi:methionyl-tRNA synthetase
VNNELVAIFGNFINRVMVLSHKYFDGKVMEGSLLTDSDKEALYELTLFPEKIEKSINTYRFREALSHFINVARLGNKYLADEEPWKVIKTDEERVKTVLNVGLQIAANLAVLAQPFLPFTADSLFSMLNLTNKDWENAGKQTLLNPGHQLGESKLLFEKITDEEVQFQLDKLEKAALENAKSAELIIPAKSNITFDDFNAMDIRTAKIIAAEKVAKTKKLLKLTVDTGLDQRTVVSGIAEFYKPEEIIGKQVSVLINLEPRNIKGIQSQGMILMAEDSSGKLSFVAPVDHIQAGSVVR